MYKLEYWQSINRVIRQGDLKSLGESTVGLICREIDAGNYEKAKSLAQYFITESKGLHDLYCDWCYDILDKIARKYGEEAMYELMRESQSTWMMRRTWKSCIKMTPYQRLMLNAEILRAHRCGPRQIGELDITEDAEKFTLSMDPCGSGGRQRRGDPVDGTPSRLGGRYNFGRTSREYPWSWSQKGVPYYCVHCAINEILMIEWGGWPLWVTEYDPDPEKPCKWIFYKNPELIPNRYWERLGFRKPESFF